MKKTVILLIALLLISCAAHGQTPTTTTHCTRSGDNVDCTSTDNSAQIAAQAEKDRQGEELGKSMGNALGAGIGAMARAHNFHKQVKQYCKQHPRETWTWGNNNSGEVYKSGQCPESNRQTKQPYVPKQLDAATQAFIDERDRLARSPEQQARLYRSQAGCESRGYIWGNGQCTATATTVKSSALPQRDTYCKQYPRGSFGKPDGSWEYCDVRDDPANQVSTATPSATTKAVASNIPQTAPAVAPAASAPADTTAAPKPCFKDKSGHTVCLAQH